MKRKYNLRKIKTKRSYTSEELAETLKVHVQTVHDWKRNGLLPLEEKTSPHLFLGTEIKKFLTKFASKHKVSLKDGEFYCLSCKKAVKPTNFESIRRGITIGNNRESLILKADCPTCLRVVYRFSSAPLISEDNKPLVTKQIQNAKDLERDSITLFD